MYLTKRILGFSLVELLISAAILALLASAAMPLTELATKRRKEQELRTALREIRSAIDAYKAASSNNKIAIPPGQSGYPSKLADLVTGVADANNPSGPPLYFLRKLPRDPFFAAPNTLAADTWAKRSFSSPADAPAEGDDVFDVYSSSTETGLNGVPYREW